MLERGQPVSCVDVDDVVARRERPAHGQPVPAAQVADVLDAHPPRLDRLVPGNGQMRGPERWDSPVQVPGRHPAVNELDPRERAVRLDLLDQSRVRGNVGVVPEPAFDEAADVRARVDLHLLGADDGPAAFRLDPSHDRVRRRVAMAHAVAVRHLEEAVARCHRTESDRLEENVVTRVAHGLGEEAPGDDQAHDVARPVPDLVELRIAIPLLNR